jgi:S-adenosyl methyltransferase
MSGDGDRSTARRGKAVLIDATVPNAARAADFLRGGTDNFTADRKAIREIAAAAPAIERIPAEARAFRRRAIRYLVAEAGIRQFLDIGTGLVPPGSITHEIAQAIDPECRIVYSDSDPLVLSRAQAMIKSTRPGSVSCFAGDIADVDAILASALPTLDLSGPVAVLLLSTLAHVPAPVAASRAVSSLMAAVPSGSYAALYHLANDLDPAMPAAARHWNKTVPTPITLRSRTDILALVSGLELIPPGVVPVTEWHPDGTPAAPVPVHGVVARKPLSVRATRPRPGPPGRPHPDQDPGPGAERLPVLCDPRQVLGRRGTALPVKLVSLVSGGLAEQVAGDAGQVGAHRLHGGVGVAGPEGGDDRVMVGLVELPTLPGCAAPLEVAPDLPVPR